MLDSLSCARPPSHALTSHFGYLILDDQLLSEAFQRVVVPLTDDDASLGWLQMRMEPEGNAFAVGPGRTKKLGSRRDTPP